MAKVASKASQSNPTIYVVELKLSGFTQWVPLLHNGAVAAYHNRASARKVAQEYKSKQPPKGSTLLNVHFSFRVVRYSRKETKKTDGN